MADGYVCEQTAIHAEVVQAVKATLFQDEVYNRTAGFFKLLGDPTRVKIIAAMDCREICVCDIASILNMTKSAVSHQLASLREGGFVKCRREGKTVYYSLADAHIKEILESGIAHMQE